VHLIKIALVGAVCQGCVTRIHHADLWSVSKSICVKNMSLFALDKAPSLTSPTLMLAYVDPKAVTHVRCIKSGWWAVWQA
jgi:hypothetical protein